MATRNEEQEKWLADAMNVVKQQGFYMKRALVRIKGVLEIILVLS